MMVAAVGESVSQCPNDSYCVTDLWICFVFTRSRSAETVT